MKAEGYTAHVKEEISFRIWIRLAECCVTPEKLPTRRKENGRFYIDFVITTRIGEVDVRFTGRLGRIHSSLVRLLSAT